MLLTCQALKNTYLNNSIKKLTTNLKPRYINIEYNVKQGDTYESIINNLDIPNLEKKIFLNTITKDKNTKILKLNQKIFFKIDKKNNIKIVNFIVEIDKRKNILFKRAEDNKSYISKIIEKNLIKTITFKEAIIKNSLYNAAIKIGIKPNTIIEFARLYGFQVDFQRDIWKNDSFQIIYEEFKNEKGNIVEVGEIIYANLNIQNTDLQLYKFEYEN